MKMQHRDTIDLKRQQEILEHSKVSTKALLLQMDRVGAILKELRSLEEARKKITGQGD